MFAEHSCYILPYCDGLSPLGQLTALPLGECVSRASEIGSLLPSVLLCWVAAPCDEELHRAAALSLCDDALDLVCRVAVAVGLRDRRQPSERLRSRRKVGDAVSIALQLIDVERRVQRLQLRRQREHNCNLFVMLRSVSLLVDSSTKSPTARNAGRQCALRA